MGLLLAAGFHAGTAMGKGHGAPAGSSWLLDPVLAPANQATAQQYGLQRLHTSGGITTSGLTFALPAQE